MNKLFFHTKPAKNTSRITVAAIIENGTVKFGVSRCSAKDSFVKKQGRMIASGRALKKPFTITPSPEANLIPWFVGKAKEIAFNVEHNPQLVHESH